jgi:hypothetical protein
VNFARTEIWTDPDGNPHLMVRGRCARCQSLQLIEPSQHAVETAKARLGAAAAIRRVARGSAAGTP